MLEAEPAELEARARRIADGVAGAEVVQAAAKVGGGALPLLELPGPAVALTVPGLSPDELAARLRAGDPPVVGRIEDDRLLLDPRTLTDQDVETVAAAVRAAMG